MEMQTLKENDCNSQKASADSSSGGNDEGTMTDV
jgi:hypothetical protein